MSKSAFYFPKPTSDSTLPPSSSSFYWLGENVWCERLLKLSTYIGGLKYLFVNSDQPIRRNLKTIYKSLDLFSSMKPDDITSPFFLYQNKFLIDGWNLLGTWIVVEQINSIPWLLISGGYQCHWTITLTTARLKMVRKFALQGFDLVRKVLFESPLPP